ncbi:hypothetical protein GN956_G8926 [Arapaima gigas]
MAPSAPVLQLLYFFAVVLPCVFAGLIKLECDKENTGIYGQSSMINCLVKGASDVTIIMVLWKKSEKLLFMFYDGHTTFEDSGFHFAEPNWNQNNMNVSLLVKNTQIADAGQYECEVVSDSGEDKKQPDLQVRAIYSKQVMSSLPEKDIKENMEVTLFCNASGGYPAGSIHWFDEYGTNWTKSSELNKVVENDKRVTLLSKFAILQAASTSSKYKCVLYDSNGIKQDEVIHDLPFVPVEPPLEKRMENRNTVAITAVVVVVGSLACGVLVLMLLQRRRSAKNMNYMDPCDIREDLNAKEKMDTAAQV